MANQHEEQDSDSWVGNAPRMQLFGRSYRLPASVMMRRVIGIALVLLGFLGFLPVLGFWMIPLGLIILSQDSAPVRRWRRRVEVWWGRKRARDKPSGPGNGPRR